MCESSQINLLCSLSTWARVRQDCMGESSHFDKSSRFDFWASVRQIIYRRECKQFWHVACVRQGECSLDYSVYARARKQFDMWASVRQIIYARVHKTTFNMWASFRQIIYERVHQTFWCGRLFARYIYIYMQEFAGRFFSSMGESLTDHVCKRLPNNFCHMGE